jgi:hypothetical protein
MGWNLKPQQEVKAPDTLTPIGMINMEGSPWHLPHEEPRWEVECPRQKEEEDPDFVDRLNFIDTVYAAESKEYIDITEEQLEEVRKRAARQARLEILNQMDEASKERLRREYILAYSRKDKIVVAPPPTPKIVPPPPPPPVHDLPPQPTPTIEDFQLNIDVTNMMGKMNMVVPLTEMCKIPSVRKEVLKSLKLQMS